MGHPIRLTISLAHIESIHSRAALRSGFFYVYMVLGSGLTDDRMMIIPARQQS